MVSSAGNGVTGNGTGNGRQWGQVSDCVFFLVHGCRWIPKGLPPARGGDADVGGPRSLPPAPRLRRAGVAEELRRTRKRLLSQASQ